MPIMEFEKPINDLSEKITELEKIASEQKMDLSNEINILKEKLNEKTEQVFNKLTPIQKVQLARTPERPTFLDYIKYLSKDTFLELKGDRKFSDDQALIGGWADIDNNTFMVLGQQRGKSTQENLKRNFGMAHPEGYRKALRLMRLAEKFSKPILTFVDTQGAYPGIGAEERGQAEAIAKNIYEMFEIRTPIIVVIIGEGGSGGALGIAIGDRILMMQHAIYSVISPEGCAAILWRDAQKSDVAAENLKITATDLKKLKVIDNIIPEPMGGAHTNFEDTFKIAQKIIINNYNNLKDTNMDDLLKQRYDKFRNMGEFAEIKK